MLECPTCGDRRVYFFKDVSVVSVSGTTGVFLISGYGNARFVARWDYLPHICPRYSVPCQVGATGSLALSQNWLRANGVVTDHDPKHPASLAASGYRRLAIRQAPGAEWVRVAPLAANAPLDYFPPGGVLPSGVLVGNPPAPASPVYELPAELITGYVDAGAAGKLAPRGEFGLRFGVVIPGISPDDHDDAVVKQMRKYTTPIEPYEADVAVLDGAAQPLTPADVELLSRQPLIILERLYDVPLVRFATDTEAEQTFTARLNPSRREHVNPAAGLDGASPKQTTGVSDTLLTNLGF